MLCPEAREHRTVDGMPPAALMDARFIDKRGPHRLRYADQMGTRCNTNRFQRVRDLGIELLAKNGIEIETRSRSKEPLLVGSGRYAEVYGIKGEDWVVKITGDKTEAVAWARVAQATREGEVDAMDMKALGEVKCVYLIPAKRSEDRDLYAIIMKRYTGLSRPEKSLVEQIDRLILVGDATAGIEPCMQAPYLAQSEALRLAKKRTSIKSAEDQARSLIETFQNLAKIGVFIYDIHGDNAMKGEDGQWRITDIGVAEVAYPISLPVLS